MAKKHQILSSTTALLFLLAGRLVQKSSGGVLTSLAILEELTAPHNHTTVQRRGNLNSYTILESNEGDILPPFLSDTNFSICHLASLLPLSQILEDNIRAQYTSVSTLEGIAATFLALHHLNTGNGTIVPQVAGLPERCSIKFTNEVLDTQLTERVAMDHVISLVERRDPAVTPLPCAFLGAYRSAVSIPTSTVTGLKGYPQFSALSTSALLDDAYQFPLFGRFNSSDNGTAEAIILFYKNVIGVDYLGIVHSNEAYGNTFSAGLKQAAAEHAPDMRLVSFDIPYYLNENTDIVKRVVARLKQTGFRYFFGVIWDTLHFDVLMNEAVKQGIAGTGEHSWIFSDSVGPSHLLQRTYERDTPLCKASTGIGIITAVGGVSGEPAYDRFFEALRELDNEEDRSYIRSKLPRYENNNPDFWDTEPFLDTFLQGPGLVAPFLYDSVIALGLASCELAGAGDTLLLGEDHFARTLKANFSGATGPIVMHQETGTRVASSATFALSNYIHDKYNGSQVSFKGTVTNVFRRGEWTTIEEYIWNDLSTNPPVDIPPLETDKQHIATIARIMIICLGIMLVSLCFGLGWWTHKNRHTSRVIRASQPVFLQLINFGSLLMGGSLFTLAIDDKIASERGCTISCAMFPWLLALGFVTVVSSLFTKTHRLLVIVNEKRFRRVTVSATDVMKPMFVLLTLNVAVLALWHGLAPVDWVREPTELDVFRRTIVSIGKCSYDNSLPYVIILGVTDFGALIYACYEGYKAREISTEYAESEFVFKAMALVLLVCFIGIPAAIVATDNTTAYNCVIAGAIFCVALSFELLIFMPKIKFHLIAQLEAEAKKKERPKNFLFRRDTTSSHDYAPSIAASDSAVQVFGMNAYHRRITLEHLELENKELRAKLRLLELGPTTPEGPFARKALEEGDDILQSMIANEDAESDDGDPLHRSHAGESVSIAARAESEEDSTLGFLTKAASLEATQDAQRSAPLIQVLYRSTRRVRKSNPSNDVTQEVDARDTNKE